MFSTRHGFGIAEYPDSDKVGIWAGQTHYMLRRSGHLEYWDGEPSEATVLTPRNR
jgi:hypothetical protein